jgi:hypothetical protein
MLARICRKSHIIILALACRSVLPLSVAAQEVTPPVVSRGAGLLGAAGPNAMVGTIDLDVSVQGPDGAVIEGAAVVTVMKLNGQFYRQGTTKKGTVRFDAVAQPSTRYKLLLRDSKESRKTLMPRTRAPLN